MAVTSSPIAIPDWRIPVTVALGYGDSIDESFPVSYVGYGLMVTDIIIINGAGAGTTNATVSEATSGAILAQLLTVVDGGTFYWHGSQWFGNGSQINANSGGPATSSILVTGYLQPDLRDTLVG
jgi:hypothetical protein